MSTTTYSVPTAKKSGKTLLTGGVAALAGLMFGLDIGVISGALGFIAKQFSVSETMQELIVSSMMFGAAVGAILAGYLSSSFGRKRSLILSATLFVVSSLLCALAPSVGWLLAGRVLLGVAIGVATFTAPLYISEIADEARRGSMISTYQLMITIGILVAFISDALLSYSGAWRWMLGLVAIPGALFLAGVFVLPDSPRWLMMKGRRQDAVDVLNDLRQDDAAVQSEIKEIEDQLRNKQQGFAMFRANSNFRRSVWFGVLLQVMQQFTGMNVVMYYAPKIFGLAGFGQNASLWGTAVVGVVNVLATFIAIGLVDRWGRRPMLISGFAVMAIGMGILGLLIFAGIDSELQRILAIAVLLCFITGFAFSAGPLIWVLCSEVQPLQGRDFGIACSTFTNWAANFVVGQTFLTLLSTFGNAQTFWLYAALNALFIVVTITLVPETKGISLEHIERNLMEGRKLRAIGR
ncbi:sugar porter family MFS transporter [Lichenicoccus roseus]|uniref:Sugar porter family MFS transporter n=1 Tax=Lichenicoccus roseus TaxID=2683649 RepID=A0A5R9J839_9PROT|nr:sugar porter family MFS transporter [Lichenicoccus roseus]TLU73784.1 sugar porter family MFS transporter [Lichenicoccus roseus]